MAKNLRFKKPSNNTQSLCVIPNLNCAAFQTEQEIESQGESELESLEDPNPKSNCIIHRMIQQT